METQACKDYKIQVQKIQNMSILWFFGKASKSSKQSIPLTMAAPAHTGGILGEVAALHPNLQLHKPTGIATDSPAAQSSSIIAFQPSVVVLDIASELEQLISNLPTNIGVQTGSDPLNVFTTNPRLVDDLSLFPDSLWEEIFNGIFKGALGWGTMLIVSDIVQNRQAELHKIVHYIYYFVGECGVSEVLMEGKLAHLMNGLKLL